MRITVFRDSTRSLSRLSSCSVGVIPETLRSNNLVRSKLCEASNTIKSRRPKKREPNFARLQLTDAETNLIPRLREIHARIRKPRNKTDRQAADAVFRSCSRRSHRSHARPAREDRCRFHWLGWRSYCAQRRDASLACGRHAAGAQPLLTHHCAVALASSTGNSTSTSQPRLGLTMGA
jgi:hypothetical protein